MVPLVCEVCGLESNDLEEVCYWDINGFPIDDEQDIERNAQNPDALSHKLCNECGETFNFEEE